jgi:hypothetical protein
MIICRKYTNKEVNSHKVNIDYFFQLYFNYHIQTSYGDCRGGIRMYALIRRGQHKIEFLKDPIDRRDKVFPREEEAKKYAEKLNLYIQNGAKWEVEKYI